MKVKIVGQIVFTTEIEMENSVTTEEGKKEYKNKIRALTVGQLTDNGNGLDMFKVTESN